MFEREDSLPTISSPLQEHTLDLPGYQRFLQQLIVELATQRRTIVKLVGLPDGTFALNAQAASTGAQDLHHIELTGGVCPHCLILYTMNGLAGHTSLIMDEGFVAQAANRYVEILQQSQLPEVLIMHVSTLQGPGGQMLAQQTTAEWIARCHPADPQPERLPFTGGCSKHAFSGR